MRFIEVTNNMRVSLSSATQATRLPKPTFRSFGAPSPLEIVVPPLDAQDEHIRELLKEIEKALFNGMELPPGKLLFEGLESTSDYWYERDSKEFRNEYIGVPYPYTEVREKLEEHKRHMYQALGRAHAKALFTEPSGEVTGLQKEIDRPWQP